MEQPFYSHVISKLFLTIRNHVIVFKSFGFLFKCQILRFFLFKFYYKLQAFLSENKIVTSGMYVCMYVCDDDMVLYFFTRQTQLENEQRINKKKLILFYPLRLLVLFLQKQEVTPILFVADTYLVFLSR